MRRPLEDVLEEARARGFLGPGAVRPHIDHSLAMARLVGGPPGHLLDLGSGGGVPGLVLATLWSETETVLLEAMLRRARFLDSVIGALGLPRCAVVRGRAEDVARDPDHRGRYDAVVARAFGPPATTAECGAPFLRVGGRLVVSEPPDPDASRWPMAGLTRLGLGPADLRRDGDTAVAVMTVLEPASDAWPRRRGIPAKRPLWGPRPM